MHPDGASLAALIGSRICHDLINPIGAISNGLELVGMGGTVPGGPEMTLIQQSCDNATARIRFFRVAFGSAGDTRPVAMAQARKTLADHYEGTRITTDWQIASDLGRDRTQLAYLSVLCLESCLPQGGRIALRVSGDDIVAAAHGRAVHADSPLWSVFDPDCGRTVLDLRPADVQFALLSRLCADADRHAQMTFDPDHIQLTLRSVSEFG